MGNWLTYHLFISISGLVALMQFVCWGEQGATQPTPVSNLATSLAEPP
jgi:hypothetical protein